VNTLTTYRAAKRHVKGDAPEVPALSAIGVAKPDKAQLWTH